MTKVKTRPNNLKQVEMRTVKATNFSTRASDNGVLQVSGYVNETGQQSDPIPNFCDVPEDLPNSDSEAFTEVMKPGVFKDALANLDDASGFVDFYFEHDPDKYLASTKDGSMSLSEDDIGLKMTANVAPTSWGKDTYTLIKSGAIGGMSFGFIVLNDSWDVTGDIPVRTVNKIELFEVSAVRFPAYPTSNIEARNRAKKLNKTLEKRGLTLGKVTIPKGGKTMTEKQEKRANSGNASMANSADVQNLASGINANTAAINNLNQSVQEQSEVLNDVVSKLLQSANERSKKPAKREEKRSDKPKNKDKPAKKPKKAVEKDNKKENKRAKKSVKGGKRVADKPKKDNKKSTERGKDVKLGEKADKMMADFADMKKSDLENN